MDIDRYKSISKADTEFKEVSIVAYIPTPTELEYKMGYITRHFVQSANDKNAPIYEIRKKSISKFSNNSLYITTSLDWRIKGPVDEVKKSNSASIRIASQIIPKLSLYLPNLLQFHKK